MAINFNAEINEDFSLVVKNTFLVFESSACARQRLSVPASTRLCIDSITNIVAMKKCDADGLASELPTYAHTEASTCSECGTRTPMSEDDLCLERVPSQSSLEPSYACSDEVCAYNLWNVPPPPAAAMVLSTDAPVQSHRLSPKADLFQPQSMLQNQADAQLAIYRQRFVDVVNNAKRIISDSMQVSRIELSETDGTWCLILKPNAACECDDTRTPDLLKIAQDALLEASSKSKCIYLMGFCSPEAFAVQPQGFQVSLGAMENAKTACWHVFKKGFCRHGTTCNKQHPACEIPLRVLVESTSLNACTNSVADFKQDMANMAMAVTATLEQCDYTDTVEAHKDKDCQGWTIEVMPKEELKAHKDYLLSLAKNTLFAATSCSENSYIMSYATQPFVSKADGFVAMIGDMQDEDQACWDFYSQGVCTRGCACHWEHPQCFMPVNIVVKERQYLKCTPAVRQFLAGKGLFESPRA